MYDYNFLFTTYYDLDLVEVFYGKKINIKLIFWKANSLYRVDFWTIEVELAIVTTHY